jgi:hypothetical protein
VGRAQGLRLCRLLTPPVQGPGGSRRGREPLPPLGGGYSGGERLGGFCRVARGGGGRSYSVVQCSTVEETA